MLIRPAQLTDLNDCLTLNANSQTEHVWQMEEREEHDVRNGDQQPEERRHQGRHDTTGHLRRLGHAA